MLEFKRSDGKIIKLADNWSEITLSQYAKYRRMEAELEDQVFQKLHTKEDKAVALAKLTVQEIAKIHPEYIRKVVSFWSGLSVQEIDRCKAADVSEMFFIMNTVLSYPDYEPIEKFDFRGKTYHLPESVKNDKGDRVPMSGATFGEYIESMQLEEGLQELTKERYDVLPRQIAIIVRNPETTIDEREELFHDLPMSIALNIAFFLAKRESTSGKILGTYFDRLAKRKRQTKS